MQANNLDEQTITLESEDGRAYACRILGVFEFDNKEYALLLNLGDGEEENKDGSPGPGKASSKGLSKDENKDDASTVIMQLIEQDDQAIFRTIESDEEFERVVAYVKELAMDMADDDEDDEA